MQMLLKFLHLNIWHGQYLDAIIDFVQKEKIDILSFQEVAGGSLSTSSYINNFSELKKRLGYTGELVATWRKKGNDDSFDGNATLFRPDITLLAKEVIWLKPYREITDKDLQKPESLPRCILTTRLKVEEQELTILNAHLAWGSTSEDDENRLRQGEKVYEYVEKMPFPFIFSGDFNVSPASQIVQWCNQTARNLTIEYNITNTLNPQVHYAKHLFPPGVAVDFVYISSDICVKDFYPVAAVTLSDHLGLIAVVEI